MSLNVSEEQRSNIERSLDTIASEAKKDSSVNNRSILSTIDEIKDALDDDDRRKFSIYFNQLKNHRLTYQMQLEIDYIALRVAPSRSGGAKQRRRSSKKRSKRKRKRSKSQKKRRSSRKRSRH